MQTRALRHLDDSLRAVVGMVGRAGELFAAFESAFEALDFGAVDGDRATVNSLKAFVMNNVRAVSMSSPLGATES